MEKCNSCEKQRIIVNKKRGLCNECNFKRLNPNKERKYPQFSKSKPKQVSSKQKQTNQLFISITNQIKQDREAICEGCKSSNKPLSFAHILSRKQFPQYYTNSNNLIILCYGAPTCCHDKWDSGNLDSMKSIDCAEKMFKFIEENESIYYNKIMNKNG